MTTPPDKFLGWGDGVRPPDVWFPSPEWEAKMAPIRAIATRMQGWTPHPESCECEGFWNGCACYWCISRDNVI